MGKLTIRLDEKEMEALERLTYIKAFESEKVSQFSKNDMIKSLIANAYGYLEADAVINGSIRTVSPPEVFANSLINRVCCDLLFDPDIDVVDDYNTALAAVSYADYKMGKDSVKDRDEIIETLYDNIALLEVMRDDLDDPDAVD